MITAGVVIGKHSVIGAGSVVTKNVPDFCVAAGNPARIIKQYSAEDQLWKKVI
ncbi:Galactoside O-acetyltransferase [compost metagenome]